MKCVNESCGADLNEGAKFCGSCGNAGATPMTKCGAGHECPADQKFCGQCGEPMVKAVTEEFDAALDALVAMTKGGAGAQEFTLPADLDLEGDTDIEFDLQDMTKSSDGLDLPEGTLALDPGALLKAVSGASRGGARAIVSVLQTVGDEIVQQRQILAAMVKAQASTMQSLRALEQGRLAGLEAAVSTIGTSRNPRKAQVNFMAKSVQTGDPAEAPESPKGGVLLKAALEAEQASMIKSVDVSAIETMVNLGWDLDKIAATRPQLGAALSKQIGAGQTAH